MTDNIQSAAVSDRGLSEKRPQNEDSFLEMPTRGVFAVADGVGGAQAGDVASQMAMEILQEAFANSRAGGDVEDLMRLAIERANEAIYQMSHDLPQLSTMATTVVALHVDGNIATIGHVGDSRLYRVDARGNLFRETQDHSVVEEEVRAGRMTPAQAATHPSRNVISRALGADTTVEVDMKTIMIDAGTTFLLCSDGITRHIEDFELRELLGSVNAPTQICENLKSICYERGAEDNLTAVIVRVAAVAAGADSFGDVEENTVAAARTATAGNAAFAAPDAEAGEIPTRNLEMPAHDDFETDDFSGADTQPSMTVSPAASEFSREETIAPVAATTAPINPYTTESDEMAYAEAPASGNGFLGKLFTSLVLLLVGAGLGAGGYYIWKQSQVQAPPVVAQPSQTPVKMPEPATENTPLFLFETSRRSVDKNPEQYITAHSSTADDAEGAYLLGRAYLLQGDYPKAWTSFEKAKTLMPLAPEENKAILASEIAIGLSVINNENARRNFKSGREEILKSSSPNANANTNAGAANTEIKPLNAETNLNASTPAQNSNGN